MTKGERDYEQKYAYMGHRICVALVIIVAVAATFANNRSGSDADRPLKARQKAPLRPQRHRRKQKQVPGTGIPQIPAMLPTTADITDI